MWCRIRQTLSQLLLLGALIWLILSGMGSYTLSSANAVVSQLEEAPGQSVYQSRQTLKDLNGLSWQAIAFKRIQSNGDISLNLRLVGFPGAVEVKHPYPLALTTSLGQTFAAVDVTSEINADRTPDPNMGQYDLASILPQLSEVIPLQLSLPTTSGTVVTLNVLPEAIQEWQTVAAQG